MKDIILPARIKEFTKDMKFIKNTVGHSEADVYKVISENENYYLKTELVSQEFINEKNALKWLSGKLPVPDIIIEEKLGNTEYMLMSEIKGEMSCSQNNLLNPEATIKLLAEGIKRMWQVNTTNCPNNARLSHKLEIAKIRVDNNLVDSNEWEKDTYFSSPIDLYNYLVDNKLEEDLAFSHGDYCMPNIILDHDDFNKGESILSGFIDLGCSGVSDKYNDIAICVRSIKYNFGNAKYVDFLFKYLDIEPNLKKIEYYILLDELF